MGTERLRIAQRGFDREMILERDFSLHMFSRKHGDALDAARTGRCADLTMRALWGACQHRSRLLDFAISAAAT
jgi:hypothetical protein